MIIGMTGMQPVSLKGSAVAQINQNRANHADYGKEYQEILKAQFGKNKKAPYEDMAQEGIISYHGAQFVCDEENNRLCMGDVTNPNKCLIVSLEKGGTLMVNHDCINDLVKAVSMFSPEDQNRIMYAINMHKKAKEMEQKIEDDKQSIGDSATASTDNED